MIAQAEIRTGKGKRGKARYFKDIGTWLSHGRMQVERGLYEVV